ncbi:MAG: iron-containing alcohol dehydrogenase [Acutalibacteraceae bacterium]
MNILYKAYCRTFQAVFRLALPLLPYRKPVILESENDVLSVLQAHGIHSVLLVTDKGVRSHGLTQALEQALTAGGLTVAVYDGTAANPTTADVAAATAIYRLKNCRAVIGFGGGSAIDCAKATGACMARPRKTLAQMKGILKIRKKTPLTIAVPTTAGTGSETTLAAVITDAETRYKYPINDFPLIPDYALLSPELTVSLPPALTATTGMDALTHAVEAYIGRSTTRETRADAETAVRLIFQNLLTAYRHPDDLDARKQMLTAAYCAGNAFSKSYVGYVHAVAHSLGGHYNVPHGLANAVLLPVVLRAYGKSVYKKLHRLGTAAGLCSESDSDEQGALRFIEAICRLKHQLGIGDTIEGIRAKDIPFLAAVAAKEANPLYPVPQLMDAAQLEQFYHAVKEDKSCD